MEDLVQAASRRADQGGGSILARSRRRLPGLRAPDDPGRDPAPLSRYDVACPRPRPVKDRAGRVLRADQELSRTDGSPIKPEAIAQHLGIGLDEVAEARRGAADLFPRLVGPAVRSGRRRARSVAASSAERSTRDTSESRSPSESNAPWTDEAARPRRYCCCDWSGNSRRPRSQGVLGSHRCTSRERFGASARPSPLRAALP